MAKQGLEHEDEDGLEIDEFLLKHGVQVITERLRDGTWQAAGLPQELERAERAADVLFASTRVRAGLQHEDAAPELSPRLAQLGVAFPPTDWGDAWEEVRSRLTAAVGDLAEVVRRLAVAE
jgi:hypothetical protein